MHGSSTRCSLGLSVSVVHAVLLLLRNNGVLLLCNRLLGVSKEASFEEIQDARNYLFEVGGVAHIYVCQFCYLTSLHSVQSHPAPVYVSCQRHNRVQSLQRRA